MNTVQRRYSNENIPAMGLEEDEELGDYDNLKTIPLTVQTNNPYLQVPIKNQITEHQSSQARPTSVHPDENSSEGYETDSSDDSSQGQTLIRIPSVEGIVRGFETTVEDDEHMQYMPPRNSFTSMRKSMSFHLLMEDGTSPPIKRCKNASLNVIFAVIKWIQHSFRGIKRVTFFVYLGFVLLTLRVGELRSLRSSIKPGTGMEAPIGLYRSTWGDTVTYYGVSTKNRNVRTNSFSTTNNIPDMTVQSTITLPKSFEHLQDVSYPVIETDIPLFWHIPRSAEMLSSCFDMVLASEVGGHLGKTNEKSLKVVRHRGHKYVTVDTSSKIGIQRAKYLGLGDSQLVDAVVSLFLHDISSVFTENHKGRLFTIFRHPVERSASLFYYLSVANWEKTYKPVYSKMTIEDYAKSSRVEYNWMTRFLSGDLNGQVTNDHLNIAKEVLRRKCLVGLLEHKEETFRRFYKYFHLHDPSFYSASFDSMGMNVNLQNDEFKKSCISRVVFDDWPNRNQHPRLEEGSDVWETLKEKNYYDMQLYEYAKTIFKEQSYLVA